MKMKYLLIFGSSGLLFNSICCSAHEIKAAHSLALRGICVGLYLWSSFYLPIHKNRMLIN